jgi:NAD(P) transhydrogenase subunit alpha
MMIRRLALLAGLATVFAAPAFAAGGGDMVDPLIFRLAIFALAIFVGYYVVWSVTPALHTPLMAVTNAISSVIIVGALIAAASGSGANLTPDLMMSKGFGGVAVALAAINIFGGFLVTSRMLAMYEKKDKPVAKADAPKSEAKS